MGTAYRGTDGADESGGDVGLSAVARLLAESRPVVALTGAGISVPSGIPDFRSKGGLWSRYDIEEYATAHAFGRHPRKCWRLFEELSSLLGSARPNPAHEALARLERLGVLDAVVTQNIDNLHQEAGSRNVVEFHGSGAALSCLSCGARHGAAEADRLRDAEGIPLCRCGAVLKPDIVLFGEPIPEQAMEAAQRLAGEARAILVVGTSATVMPAALLPRVVASRGGAIIEMNLTRTELSRYARVRIEGDVAVTLPALADHIEAQLARR